MSESTSKSKKDSILSPSAVFLSNLNEVQLRDVVLVPLLNRLGMNDVIHRHGGVAEKGKDIVAYYLDLLGERRYVAIIAKANDIHGAVGKPGNAGEVLLQVQQAIDSPYTDPYELTNISIDECWVVTTGVIKSTAMESVQGTLERSNIHKLVRFIDRNRLVELLGRFYPEFFTGRHIVQRFVHELRVPLSQIRSQIARLSRPSELSVSAMSSIGDDLEIAVQLANMVVENLAFSELQVGAKLRLERLPLRSLQDVGKRLTRSLRGKIDLAWQISDTEGETAVWVDRTSVAVAVFNLVQNALRYGDKRAGVTLRCLAADGRIRFEIINEGRGFRARDLEHVFVQWYRSEESVRRHGTGIGLGLPVARQIAQLHGGNVWVERAEAPTTVCLDLPIGDRT